MQVERPTVLRVRLTPRGGRSALVRWQDGILHARVTAAPVDGAANRALIALLADTLRIPKSRIAFRSGETSRDKVLEIASLDEQTLAERLRAAVEGNR